LVIPDLVLQDLLALQALFLLAVSVTFGFTFAAVLAALAKKSLINENRYRWKRFVTWTRIILLTPPLISHILLRLFGFGSEIYWPSLAVVVIIALAIMYYPDTVLGFVDLTTVLLDRVLAIRNRYGRMTDENE